MTRPRLHPDRPRVCADTKAWAALAKAAGASIWQIAVFVQRTPDTCYRAIARARAEGLASLARHHRRRARPRKMSRVERALVRQQRSAVVTLAASGFRWRCSCGGPSDSPDGHAGCRVAA